MDNANRAAIIPWISSQLFHFLNSVSQPSLSSQMPCEWCLSTAFKNTGIAEKGHLFSNQREQECIFPLRQITLNDKGVPSYTRLEDKTAHLNARALMLQSK